MAEPEGRRRLVTGLRDGIASFVVDEENPGEQASEDPRHRRSVVWGADRALQVPNDGSEPARADYFPTPPGWRLVLADVPPGFGTESVGVHEPGEKALSTPGAFHVTTTVDVVVILRGELTVLLEGGEERTLRVGDSLVQNGLAHAWQNRGEEVATMATLVVGAETNS